MAANLFHHLPVVDEQHKVLGIVSSFDIIRHLAAQDVHL
jgi:CBS-domain-containing membrane protein